MRIYFHFCYYRLVAEASLRLGLLQYIPYSILTYLRVSFGHDYPYAGQQGFRHGSRGGRLERLHIYPGDFPNGDSIFYFQAHYRLALTCECVQQMFVFGEVQDPNVDTVNLVEDIVRSQIIELVSHTWILFRICTDLHRLYVFCLHRSSKLVH